MLSIDPPKHLVYRRLSGRWRDSRSRGGHRNLQRSRRQIALQRRSKGRGASFDILKAVALKYAAAHFGVPRA